MDLRHDEETRCSDLRLDRYLSGEFGVEVREAFAAHLAASPLCRTRCGELAADRRRFDGRPAVGACRDGATTGAPRLSRRYALAMTLTAAASVAVVLWPSGEPSAERSKGSGFVVHASRGGDVTELVEGALVRPGDRLRFSFPGSAGRFVAVVGQDGSGRTAPYLPMDGETVRMEDASRPVEGAVSIDAAPGDERLFGCVCESPVPVASLAAALRDAAGDAAPQVEGCTVHRRALTKDVEPPHAR